MRTCTYTHMYISSGKRGGRSVLARENRSESLESKRQVDLYQSIHRYMHTYLNGKLVQRVNINQGIKNKKES